LAEGAGVVELAAPWLSEELLQENNRKEQNMTLEPRKFLTIASENKFQIVNYSADGFATFFPAASLKIVRVKTN